MLNYQDVRAVNSGVSCTKLHLQLVQPFPLSEKLTATLRKHSGGLVNRSAQLGVSPRVRAPVTITLMWVFVVKYLYCLGPVAMDVLMVRLDGMKLCVFLVSDVVWVPE